MMHQLERLAQRLAASGLPALLIGGHALQAYGVVRQTVDIDFLVDDEGAESFGCILAEEGYRETARTTTFIRFIHDAPVTLDVDLLLVEKETLTRLSREGATYVLGSTMLQVPSLPHLIALKLHAAKNNPDRELREASDIAALMEANPNGISKRELIGLCERYGSRRVLSLLEEHL